MTTVRDHILDQTLKQESLKHLEHPHFLDNLVPPEGIAPPFSRNLYFLRSDYRLRKHVAYGSTPQEVVCNK
ncbi:MAG: hypothetical protein QG653_353 [Patescibacteria group bacterium]|nr:hypothetical protein [Patescibacteria group bacterium]